MGTSIYLWERPGVLFVVEEGEEGDRIVLRLRIDDGDARCGRLHPSGSFAGWVEQGKVTRVC